MQSLKHIPRPQDSLALVFSGKCLAEFTFPYGISTVFRNDYTGIPDTMSGSIQIRSWIRGFS
jgi:hypothetical protein